MSSYAPMSSSIARAGPPTGNNPSPSQMEMDEALARQLQRQEMDGISTPLILGSGANLGGLSTGGGGGGGLGGSLGGGGGGGGREGSGRGGSTDEARQTRLNALHNVREVRSASFALCIVLLVNIPQIIAAVIILAKYWNDQTCIPSETAKWKVYALIAATRMTFYVSTVTALYHLNGRLTPASRLMRFLSHARNGLDAFGLIWFVVGNMWLFGGDVEICPHPNRSPLYTLCVAMVFINYAQLCLPCVVVIVMLPVLCFCLPCLIRVLARIQDPMRGKGATPSMINKLPSMKYRQMQAQAQAQAAQQQQQQQQQQQGQGGPGQLSVTGVESNSTSCAICISEYAPEEDIRLLPCAHYFHSTCVDEWLKVNASCPTCRASILPDHPDHPHTPRYGTTAGSASTPRDSSSSAGSNRGERERGDSGGGRTSSLSPVGGGGGLTGAGAPGYASGNYAGVNPHVNVGQRSSSQGHPPGGEHMV